MQGINHSIVTRFYDRFASVYDLLFDEVFRPGRIQAIELMRLSPGERVLEVGIGTGLNLPLYPAGVHTVGIDLSAPMLREAALRRRKNHTLATDAVALARMDATHLALADESFHHVYAPYVVSVVPRPREVVAEMARVCKPGGMVIVLNHFGSRNPVGSWIEKRLTPLTNRVGFRLDLPLQTVLDLPGLAIEENRRVNVLKLWRLLVFRKTDRATVEPLAIEANNPWPEAI